MRTVLTRKVATIQWSTMTHFARVNDTSTICGVQDPAWPGKIDRLVFEAFNIDELPQAQILELVTCKTCKNLFSKSTKARESCIHTKKITLKR